MSDHSLLKTPGEMIFEAREAQDLTIAQLSERTKIPPAVLAALELDEFHKISGPLYIKSFLRTCALDLGLNPQTVLDQYEKISGEKRSGPVGKEMVWKEEEVLVNRVGLPWLRIILVVGIVAILFGVVLFALRGCGGGESSLPNGQPGAEGLTRSDQKVAAVASGDSAAALDARRESLMPASTEADLRERADALQEMAIGRGAEHDSVASLPDSLAVGWLMNPPQSETDVKPPVEAEARDAHSAPVEVPQETETRQETVALQEAKIPLVTETVSEVLQPEAAPDSFPEVPSGEVSDEVTPEDISTQVVPVEITSQDGPTQEVPVEIRSGTSLLTPQVDSAWPLVLRIVCDAPQEILVKRDGDAQFSTVLWPDEVSAAPPVPPAGFEAGRAYRDGQRLVVFWGAEDHFSLKLERVRGVEVAINGRIRDVARLRSGQELILDAHAAGAPPNR